MRPQGPAHFTRLYALDVVSTTAPRSSSVLNGDASVYVCLQFLAADAPPFQKEDEGTLPDSIPEIDGVARDHLARPVPLYAGIATLAALTGPCVRVSFLSRWGGDAPACRLASRATLQSMRLASSLPACTSLQDD